jgi:cyclic pyranopterin phosphate synthase
MNNNKHTDKSNKMQLTHTDSKGDAVMVDVGKKHIQTRIATASGDIILSKETTALILSDEIKKGSVLTISKIAAIMAAKKTSDIIPLCHPLILNVVNIELTVTETGINARSYVSCNGVTGVEMEALSAVSVALLTIYDMCKAVDKNMSISNIKLISKEKINL